MTRVSSVGSIGSVGVCPAFPFELWRAHRGVTVLHEPNPLALVSHWAAAQRGPLVVWFHSEVVRPQWKYRLLYRPFLRRALRLASRIVVSSPNLAEHAAELRDFRAKCVVIPFGIDTRRLEPTPGVQACETEIRRRFPGLRILFLGRLVSYKGIDVLLRAMREVDATALIGGEGPLRGSLETQARRSGLGDKVQFLGHLSDEQAVAHLRACDMLVLPSVTRAETFGVVQLEAMACGKPVVSTNLPTGVPWVNRHGETGLVVEPGEAAGLAAALRALAADTSLRERMGECGRSRVAEHFTVERMASRASRLYREVLLESGFPAGPVESGHAVQPVE